MSMTFSNYVNFSKYNAGSEDQISLEPINFTGRNFISYLQLVNQCPVAIVNWDTQNSYKTFITHQIAFDPFTKVRLNPSFRERILLNYDAITKLGEHYEPSEELLKILFDKFLYSHVTPDEKLILCSFLFLDMINIIHTFSSSGECIRNDAEELIKDSEEGTWFFRKGSWIESNLITSKVITSKYLDTIIHIVFIHVKGVE